MTTFIPVSDGFAERRRRVDIVTGAGIAPPPRWVELNQRVNDYLALDADVLVERLAQAVIDPPKNVDLCSLWVSALAAQASPQTIATVQNRVVAAVQKEMIAAYQPVAANNYRTLAEQFDSIAAEFDTCCRVVDVSSSPVSMVTANDESRAAWVEAERLAHRLDSVLEAMCAAAELAGTRLDDSNGELGQLWYQGNLDDAAVLALAVEPGPLHRRKVWTAWMTTEGRCHRWQALHKLGARIRAADLDDFTPYRRPAAIVHRQEQIVGQPRGTVRMAQIDPEDGPVVQPIDPVRPSRLTTI